MVRTAWKLRREGGGVKAENEEFVGVGVFVLSFHSLSSCHSSGRLHHDWNTGSEELA